MKHRILRPLALAATLVLLPFACRHGEHPRGPEHPAGGEHPTGAIRNPAPETQFAVNPGTAAGRITGEQVTERAVEPTLTKDDLADAIESYVRRLTADKGEFRIHDDVLDKDVVLTLDKVHRERLSKVGPDTYFACADFKTPDGSVYDIDLFMKGTSKDNLVFYDMTLHKFNGKERYTWEEKDGIWSRKPVAGMPEPRPLGITAPEPPAAPSTPAEHPETAPTEHPQ
jgi:hypothetical protein